MKTLFYGLLLLAVMSCKAQTNIIDFLNIILTKQ